MSLTYIKNIQKLCELKWQGTANQQNCLPAFQIHLGWFGRLLGTSFSNTPWRGGWNDPFLQIHKTYRTTYKTPFKSMAHCPGRRFCASSPILPIFFTIIATWPHEHSKWHRAKNRYIAGFAHPIQLSQLPRVPSRQTQEWIGLWVACKKNLITSKHRIKKQEMNCNLIQNDFSELKACLLRSSVVSWGSSTHSCSYKFPSGRHRFAKRCLVDQIDDLNEPRTISKSARCYFSERLY